MRLLKSEYLKTRRRFVFLTALLVTAAEIFWALHGDYDAGALKRGWMVILYQFPVINAIFLPLLSIIVSSRLCDIEHRGNTLKQLAVMSEKGKIYDAKFIYGFSIVLFCITINFAATITFGLIKGFYGEFPLKLYLLYLLFTIAPTFSVYAFQHVLSLLYKNQTVSFFAGAIGTFIGLFSMFLQNLPLLRRIFIWGYYGTLQLVGLYGYTKETHWDNAYFEVYKADLFAFASIVFLGAVIYLIGRCIFIKSERIY